MSLTVLVARDASDAVDFGYARRRADPGGTHEGRPYPDRALGADGSRPLGDRPLGAGRDLTAGREPARLRASLRLRHPPSAGAARRERRPRDPRRADGRPERARRAHARATRT